MDKKLPLSKIMTNWIKNFHIYRCLSPLINDSIPAQITAQCVNFKSTFSHFVKKPKLSQLTP